MTNEYSVTNTLISLAFREEHNASTVQISLQDTLEVDLGIVPRSDQQWVVASAFQDASLGSSAADTLRLVESWRYLSKTQDRPKKASPDRQVFRWRPVRTGEVTLELHYRSLQETQPVRQFTLHLQILAK